MSLLSTLTVLAVTLVPVMAECDPSNAVVAVISVVSTLIVVALILLGIFLFVRRRRRGSFLKTRKSIGAGDVHHQDVPDGFTNAAFDGNDVAFAEQGLSKKLQGSNNNTPNKKKQDTGNDGNAKTWASFPKDDQTGILYRQGSCGSLDENNMHSDPEIISVCLESQDIIGLGFNISGNFGQGIVVSQVHNRGPAIESGKIKVGDKILSVTVSYENIVYEDALTILSYASPYPVKVTLQKAGTDGRRDSSIYKRSHSGGVKEDVPSLDHLNHPLYRSQSLDALKRVHGVKEHSYVPFAAKRAQSEIKPETRQGGSKGKKGDRSSKSFVHDVFGKIAGSFSSSRSNSNRNSEVVVSEVVVHNDDVEASRSVNENVQMTAPSKSSATQENMTTMSTSATEFASLMDEMLDLKEDRARRLSFHSDIETGIGGDEAVVISKPSPPSKPERKNKRQESLEASVSHNDIDSHQPSITNGETDLNLKKNIENSVNEVFSSSSSVVVNSMPQTLQNVDDEVDEGIIQPSVAKHEIKIGDEYVSEKVNEPSSKTKESLDFHFALDPFTQVISPDERKERPPSPEGEEVEEEFIQPEVAKKDASAPLPSAAKAEKMESKVEADSQNSEEKEKSKSNQPVFDEDMLERLIAMNSYAPGTQGWAGIQAGGEQGGIVDDFIPNSRNFMAQPVPKEHLHRMLSSESKESGSSSRPMSPPGVAFEIRDDISGKPVAVEISKTKNVIRTSSYNALLTDSSSSLNDNSGAHKSSSFHESSNTYSTHTPAKGSKINNNNNNDNNNGSFDTPLAWSGQRLVRADPFSNIPENNSVSDWTDKVVRDETIDTHVHVDDLTDSDSEGYNVNNVPQVNLLVKDNTVEVVKDTRPKKEQHSDMSNSLTSSSGEATPPDHRNGQEFESSPAFTLPTPAIHILSNEIGTVGKGNTFSLSHDDSDVHDEVDC